MSDIKYISQSQIDTNGNGSVSWDEWKKASSKVKAGDQIKVTDNKGNVLLNLTFEEIQKLLRKKDAQLALSAENNSPAKASRLDDEGKSLMEKIEELYKDYKQAEFSKNKAELEKLSVKLLDKVNEARYLQSKGATSVNASMINKCSTALGLLETGGGAKAQVLMNSGTSSGSSGGLSVGQPGSQAGMKAQGMSPQGQSLSPSGWGAKAMGVSGFSSDAYMKSMATTDNILTSLDSINDSQKRGKELMNLFYYFARMAESGDLGGIYQFMKFITYIVSKDKAKQQIEMGKKLIALQDLSRQWTNKLMNVSSDSSDPDASNELMKTMTLVKSETDAIATSQKLISQMLEEAGVAIETLTNSTKNILQVYARVQQKVSS